VNSLPETVTRQRRNCDLNPGPTAPESSTLTTQLPSRPFRQYKLVKCRNKLKLINTAEAPEEFSRFSAVRGWRTGRSRSSSRVLTVVSRCSTSPSPVPSLHRPSPAEPRHTQPSHPALNWPVYADVFEHSPPRLASRRPIRSKDR